MQVSYTSKAWNSLIKDPQNRLEAANPATKSFGGKIEKAFLAFGDWDVVDILQMPENVDAAAISMDLKAGEAMKW